MAIINGVGVVVIDRGRVLLGRKLSGAWAGCWSLPGGKIEFGEALEECARRELLEETGLVSTGDLTLFSVSSEIDSDHDFHSVTFGVRLESYSGTVSVCEPDKFGEWRWFRLDELPYPLFRPTRSVLSVHLGDTTEAAGRLELRDLRPGEFLRRIEM